MFSQFEQLPQEIQLEILLYVPNSLPQIVRVSKSINQLIGNDIYRLFHIGPTRVEILKYLNTRPSMFFQSSFNNKTLDLCLMHYNTTMSYYKCYTETAKYEGNSIRHNKNAFGAILDNNKIVSDPDQIEISLEDKEWCDLKTEYEIYNQRIHYVKFNKRYAQSRISERLNQMYNKYAKCEDIDLIFLFYYLNHSKAVFLNSEIEVMHQQSIYLTCYDELPIDNNGILISPMLPQIKSDVENLYSELLDIIEKL